MEVTFLGHQGWMLSSQETHILIDPVLTDTFGTSKELQFKIYPPRSIDHNQLPKLSGIFITNEHLDHFHLPSLKLLDKSIPIYVGRVMPDCVKNTIKQLGFELFELSNTESVKLVNLNITFYIGSPSVPFWEKRCYQLYVMDENEIGVFIQSDTLVNQFFISQVNEKLIPCPKIFIATNNAQILPQDMYGAFDNLLFLDSSSKNGCTGINFLEEVLIQYPAQLPEISILLLSGSGYIIDHDNAKPFLFSEVNKLNEYLDELALGTQAKILYPGEQVRYKCSKIQAPQQLDWIKLNFSLYEQINNRLITNSSPTYSLIEPIFFEHDDLFDLHLELIEQELINMAQHLLLSVLGRSLLLVNEYLNGPLNAYRFVIELKRKSKNSIIFQLDVNAACFKMTTASNDDLTHQYPFGLILYFSDFIALLQGKIQIWELATANMRQWYLGDKLESPVAFLYAYFSEQIRPDLAYQVYKTLDAR
ncbi:MAG: MBL fold metallo-hydrolase [Silvanigrellaceae bacterium]|nr:MBL fold metallo-hydrolase [Silvanigrellaceae bacterium]